MNTVTSILAQMSESELLDHFEALGTRDRRTTAQLLVAISEIDERKLWARHAFPSMFAFCVERFHMSEQVTAKRIWAARTARRFPIVLEMVERGELHLTAIHLLARHLTTDNYGDVLERARHRSSREIERLVAELAPRPDISSRVRALPGRVIDTAEGAAAAAATSDATTREEVGAAQAGSGSAAAASGGDTKCSESAPATAAGRHTSRVGLPALTAAARPIAVLSPRRYKIEITVDEETHDKLRSLQDLLGRSTVGRDPAAIISRAIDSLLVDTLKRKAAITDRLHLASGAPAITDRLRTKGDAFATTDREGPECAASAGADRPRPASPAREASPRQPRTRNIPAALRRAVWQRDCGRCRYTDGRGRRCHATSNIEFHHKSPFAKGGGHNTDNVELRCAAHNQYQADLDFGRDFMNARRTAGARS